MEFKRNGSQPSQKGPEEYFTGSVRIDPLMQAHEPSRVSYALVTFEPGARSAWHRHPLGQTLVVTQGYGWVQSEGGPKLACQTHQPEVLREHANQIPDERKFFGSPFSCFR